MIPINLLKNHLHVNRFYGLVIFFISAIRCYSDEPPCSMRDTTLTQYNRLVRVDNIAPTCYQQPNCKSYKINSVVLSVDKSLAYTGSPVCCFNFEILEKEVNYNASLKYRTNLMFHISKITKLRGRDYIAVYTEGFNKLLKNITVRTKNKYQPIYLNEQSINIQFNKDKDHKDSIFEIIINTYHKGDTELCSDLDRFHRCGSNTSDCIDKVFMCDHYPQCVEESDENLDCDEFEMLDINNTSYDKVLVLTILIVLFSTIFIICMLILLLCLLQNKEKMSQTFLSVFGNMDQTSNGKPETQYQLLEHENTNLTSCTYENETVLKK